MSRSPQQYYNDVIGRGFDEDGQYGCQCVDGFKHFCRTQLGLNLGSVCYGGNPTGYAYRIWYNFDDLGLGNYFDKVPANQMVDGDWAIWNFGAKPSCPYSHVAMFRKDNGNGTGIFLGQNQSGHPEYTQVNIYYNGLLGGLRPKIYHQQPAPTPQTKYINVPPTIEARNIYKVDSKQQFATIKPKKFGGLSYKVYSFVDNGYYAEIETRDFGRCLIRVTDMTPITDSPQYEHGNY